jgi:hypothetical protein
MAIAGYSAVNTIETAHFDSATGKVVYSSTFQQGLAEIDRSLIYKNKPIVVGVARNDEPVNPSSLNGTSNATAHYIIIMGGGTDAIGKYYNYWDVGTHDQATGTSPLGKLRLDSASSILSGPRIYIPAGVTYKVTEVKLGP